MPTHTYEKPENTKKYQHIPIKNLRNTKKYQHILLKNLRNTKKYQHIPIERPWKYQEIQTRTYEKH